MADTGVGIAGEQLDRIWGAFNQGSEGMARKFGGHVPAITSPNTHVRMRSRPHHHVP